MVATVPAIDTPLRVVPDGMSVRSPVDLSDALGPWSRAVTAALRTAFVPPDTVRAAACIFSARSK
jgi:hypothetical protein